MSGQMTDHYAAIHLQVCGNSVMPNVLQMLRDSKLADLCYAYKIRTKPEEKLIEKVLRKRADKPNYGLSDITDVVGLRLVALFRSEMVDLFEGVLSAITHANGVTPNPFLKGAPEEIIIYLGTNAFDELAPRLKDIVSRICPSLPVKEVASREGYSSVHLVSRLTATPEKKPTASYRLPIEIQIRSVFEDAWGEIDHKYGYVIRTGKDSGKPIGNPEFVLAHLKILKRFSDACMEYADVIKSETSGLPTELLAAKRVTSVPSDNFILDRFAALQIAPKFIEQYRQARDLKDQAAQIDPKNRADLRKAYITVAELFRELVPLLESERKQESDEAIKLASYYARMNEALCLMATNDRDHVVAAVGIYQALDPQYPGYPLLAMRYGQALGKLGYLDEAIRRLNEAGENARTIAVSHVEEPESAWPQEMPLTDYEYIASSQPKLLGYHLWLKARTIAEQSVQEKIELLDYAYQITQAGLAPVKDSQKTLLSLHNNLLYYALAIVTRPRVVPRVLGGSAIKAYENAVQRHIEFIESNDANPENLSASTLDTMMRAYSVLGRDREAKAFAKVLLGRCLGGAALDMDEKERLELVSVAYRVSEQGVVGVID